MKIEFIKLEFKNVLSYGNSLTTFEFKNGIDLINAKNGSGKSSFIDALTYALYGKAFRKIKLNSLINDKNNKELLVKLTIHIENSGYYQIVRGMKPAIFEIYHNKFDPLFEDLNLIKQSATTLEYQNILEEQILKMNENVYRQLIVLGANISASKNFMDLTSKEKEEVFQIITDTSIFNDLKLLLKKKIQVANTYISEHDYKIQLLKTSLETEQRNIKTFEEQNELIKTDKENIIKRLDDELKEREAKVPEYERAKSKLLDLKKQYQQEQEIIGTKKEELQQLNNKNRKLKDELHHIKLAKESIIVCPDCNFKINRTDTNIEEENENIIQQNINENDSIILELDKSINELESKSNAKKETLLNSRRILDNQNDNLNKINILMADIVEKRQWKEFDIDYSNIKRIEEELEEEKQNILNLKEELNNLNILTSIVSNDELKGFTLSQQMPVLNRYINQFIERFNAFEYNFVIDSSFKERIISRNEEKEFNAMSNGQKQRFTFSILFAFLKLVEEKNGISTNILILDEVLDSSSDTEGKMELIKILSDDFSNTKDVIIISHNPDIVQNVEDFNRIIRVVHDNYSKMIVE